MAFTARLKPELEAQARALADRMGISLMALVSVALAEYVSSRTHSSGASSPSPQSGGTSSSGGTSGRGPKPRPPAPVKHRSGMAAFQIGRQGVWGAKDIRPAAGVVLSETSEDGCGFDDLPRAS